MVFTPIYLYLSRFGGFLCINLSAKPVEKTDRMLGLGTEIWTDFVITVVVVVAVASAIARV